MKITRMPFWKKVVLPFKPERVYSFNTAGANICLNGELAFLRMVTRKFSRTVLRFVENAPFVCFDVGANTGDYSTEIITACVAAGVTADLHAFEPVKKSFKELKAGINSIPDTTVPPKVTFNNIALSDKAGEATIFSDEEGSSFASMYKREFPDMKFDTTEKIGLSTGADYVREKNVTHIDLLKIDVEGHELSVFRGFGEFLKPENVQYIQFEYGGACKDAGTTLRELYEYLTARGYKIGRLLRDTVEIRPYDARMEDYRYSNYVAVAA